MDGEKDGRMVPQCAVTGRMNEFIRLSLVSRADRRFADIYTRARKDNQVTTALSPAGIPSRAVAGEPSKILPQEYITWCGFKKSGMDTP